jgi:hypothetical protein
MDSSRHSHCYLLSHCQIEHPVYLGTSSVSNRCLYIYQHLYCDYSAWVVNLSVLELVQLADMFRFIVVYWVKGMNWTENGKRDSNILVLWRLTNISVINRSKRLSLCERLPLVSQGLSAVMYSQLVIEWSRTSAETQIDSFIPAFANILWKQNVLYHIFSRSPMFIYKEQVKKSI